MFKSTLAATWSKFKMVVTVVTTCYQLRTKAHNHLLIWESNNWWGVQKEVHEGCNLIVQSAFTNTNENIFKYINMEPCLIPVFQDPMSRVQTGYTTQLPAGLLSMIQLLTRFLM